MQADTGRPGKRTRKVRSYPVHPLRDALGVARAIQDVNSGLPFDRIMLAGELKTTPSSSGFTMRLNSSSRYGLTLGGYNDARISLTEAGRAAVAPKSEEERRRTLVECALRPDVFRAFYESLDGKRLPEPAFARNILERDHSIDPELSEECLDIIVANGAFVGLLRDVGGSQWVGVKAVRAPETPVPPQKEGSSAGAAENSAQNTRVSGEPVSLPMRRVFLGHMGAPEIADRVQALLADFGIEHVTVDVGRRTGAPMPAEVSKTMRECASAVLVAGPTGEAGAFLGQLLGFMVGAASVLYGPRLVVVTTGESGDIDLSGLSVRSVELGSGSAGDSSLDLLKALNETGVIHVTG